jgi:aminoglycoside phosphotransferase (APT) family kinase protein
MSEQYPTPKLHTDEVEIDAPLVKRLLVAQFPQWADLPLERVNSTGTVNAIYRLGNDKSVRLPRLRKWQDHLHKEIEWLPRFAPKLPLALPEAIEKGKPGEGYPFDWAVYRWLDGEVATIDGLADPVREAVALAGFLAALQTIDTTGAPLALDHGLRGVPLRMRDAPTRKAIADLGDMIDTEKVTSAWERALRAPDWNRSPVWFHGDALSGNVLMHHEQISAVIDFGSVGIGDPACDLMIAWSLFSGESRRQFRKALAVDDATWERGRGHMLSQALIFIPYYMETNPGGVANAWRALHEVLDQPEAA